MEREGTIPIVIPPDPEREARKDVGVRVSASLGGGGLKENYQVGFSSESGKTK